MSTVAVERTTALPIGRTASRSPEPDGAPTSGSDPTGVPAAGGRCDLAVGRGGAGSCWPRRRPGPGGSSGPGLPHRGPAAVGQTYLAQAQSRLSAAHLDAERVDAFDERVAQGRGDLAEPGRRGRGAAAAPPSTSPSPRGPSGMPCPPSSGDRDRGEGQARREPGSTLGRLERGLRREDPRGPDRLERPRRPAPS